MDGLIIFIYRICLEYGFGVWIGIDVGSSQVFVVHARNTNIEWPSTVYLVA